MHGFNLFHYRLLDELKLDFLLHLVKQRALGHDLACVFLHFGGLVDLLRQESSRFSVLLQLLFVQLHELRVSRSKPVRCHLAKSKSF